MGRNTRNNFRDNTSYNRDDEYSDINERNYGMGEYESTSPDDYSRQGQSSYEQSYSDRYDSGRGGDYQSQGVRSNYGSQGRFDPGRPSYGREYQGGYGGINRSSRWEESQGQPRSRDFGYGQRDEYGSRQASSPYGGGTEERYVTRRQGESLGRQGRSSYDQGTQEGYEAGRESYGQRQGEYGSRRGRSSYGQGSQDSYGAGREDYGQGSERRHGLEREGGYRQGSERRYESGREDNGQEMQKGTRRSLRGQGQESRFGDYDTQRQYGSSNYDSQELQYGFEGERNNYGRMNEGFENTGNYGQRSESRGRREYSENDYDNIF